MPQRPEPNHQAEGAVGYFYLSGFAPRTLIMPTYNSLNVFYCCGQTDPSSVATVLNYDVLFEAVKNVLFVLLNIVC